MCGITPLVHESCARDDFSRSRRLLSVNSIHLIQYVRTRARRRTQSITVLPSPGHLTGRSQGTISRRFKSQLILSSYETRRSLNPLLIASFPSQYGVPVGFPPSSSLFMNLSVLRAMLELLPVSESGQFDAPRFMPTLALFESASTFLGATGPSCELIPRHPTCSAPRRRWTGAQTFSVYCIRNEKLWARGHQNLLFPLGPWPKVRTTRVPIAMALYAIQCAPRSFLSNHRFEGYGTSRASKPKTSRSRTAKLRTYGNVTIHPAVTQCLRAATSGTPLEKHPTTTPRHP